MRTRVHVEGQGVSSNLFIQHGVVLHADPGFNYLVGYKADDLWPKLYEQGFVFTLVDEGHDDYLAYANDLYRTFLKKTIDKRQEQTVLGRPITHKDAVR